TGRTTQVQGVWVDPEFRGRGLAAAAMAAMVHDALRRVAPTVSLYVNDYNTPARRVYARCGFESAGEFAPVLFLLASPIFALPGLNAPIFHLKRARSARGQGRVRARTSGRTSPGVGSRAMTGTWTPAEAYAWTLARHSSGEPCTLRSATHC